MFVDQVFSRLGGFGKDSGKNMGRLDGESRVSLQRMTSTRWRICWRAMTLGNSESPAGMNKAQWRGIGSSQQSQRNLLATIVVDGCGHDMEQHDYTAEQLKAAGGIWAVLAGWRALGFKRVTRIPRRVLSGKIFALMVPE